MTTETLLPPTTSAIVTLAAVKARLGITDTSQDATLRSLIAAASGDIASVLGHPPGRARYRDMIGADGDTLLPLRRFPLDGRCSVSASHRELGAVTDFAAHDEPWSWLERRLGWQQTRGISLGIDPSFDTDPQSDWTVEYSAGWLLPGEGLRNADGEPVTRLPLAADLAIGDTAATFTATGITGSLLAPWGFRLAGSSLLYVATADAAVASNELAVTFEARTGIGALAETAGVDVVVPTGAYGTFAPQYLPAEIEEEAMQGVLRRWARRAGDSAGLTSIAASGFSATFRSETEERADLRSRLERWVRSDRC